MIQHAAHKPRFQDGLNLSPGIGEHILPEVDAETLHLGEEAVHLRRRGVVVGVVVGAEEAALTEEALLVAALALRVGLGVEVGVEVELGDEGARRQRDDASELGEALVLGRDDLARALDRRRVLLDDERAEVGAVGQLGAGA